MGRLTPDADSSVDTDSSDSSEDLYEDVISKRQKQKYHSTGSDEGEPHVLNKPLRIGIIAGLYNYCRALYKYLISKATENKRSESLYSYQEMESGYQLLMIWGHDFDVASDGLDRQLEDSHEIKMLVLSVLVSLAKSTWEVISHGYSKRSLRGSDLADLAEVLHEAESILQERTDSDNDSDNDSLVSQYDVKDHDDIYEAQNDMKAYVQNLFDLIPAIETPARTGDNRRKMLASDARRAAQGPSHIDELNPQKRRKIRETPEIGQLTGMTQGDTQALSQLVYPPREYGSGTEDEDAEDVWGYLLPLDDKVDSVLCLKTRDTPEANKSIKGKDKSETGTRQHGGYLVGRHPECDLMINTPTISNRHFLIFAQSTKGDRVAILEDLSTNGTFVNDAIVGRNRHRQLEHGDEISVLNEARFVFRYPRSRDGNGFRQQYRLQQQLGKGHFATVYLCVEIATGDKYAAKVFEKIPRTSQRSQMQEEALYSEIALLKAVNHPSLLFLREMFDEDDGVYLVLELAPKGELFNLIVSREKLTEDETRHIFRQLFEGLKYLHERGIVHRDIKPENILIADDSLTVKLGDFGLAKLIGEESFTTTLCGTPSYVAPEILQENRNRRYARPVDIWSLGVVLYICLCGFPPFSDELNTQESPYSLAQQIKMGRFDYPSPYWDSIGDPALHLIDRMLTVDPEKRLTVEECLDHPWMKNEPPIVDAEGLTGALGKLDFSKRKVERERTLLSAVNESFYGVSEGGQGGPGKTEASEGKAFKKDAVGKRTHYPVPAKGPRGRKDKDSPS